MKEHPEIDVVRNPGTPECGTDEIPWDPSSPRPARSAAGRAATARGERCASWRGLVGLASRTAVRASGLRSLFAVILTVGGLTLSFALFRESAPPMEPGDVVFLKAPEAIPITVLRSEPDHRFTPGGPAPAVAVRLGHSEATLWINKRIADHAFITVRPRNRSDERAASGGKAW